MKLQKLVYYAHGIALARDLNLANEQPQVWKLGPVFNSLYFELKYHGSNPIRAPEAENAWANPPLVDGNDAVCIRIVDSVWQELSRFTAMQLSTRTHKAGTPWFQTARQHNWRVPRGTEIDPALMRNYFRAHGLNG